MGRLEINHNCLIRNACVVCPDLDAAMGSTDERDSDTETGGGEKDGEIVRNWFRGCDCAEHLPGNGNNV